MRRLVRAVALLAVMVGPVVEAQARPSYHEATVIAAQEALARLGFDVGTADGAWGPRSRAAMNDLRAEHGLPPAHDLTGSSLALVHRLSPGATTLPQPGFFFADAKARRAWLAEHNDVKRDHCPFSVGVGGDLASYEPRVDALVDASGQPGDADWFSYLGETITGYVSRCVRDDDKACQILVDTAAKWAEVNALQNHLPLSDHRYENTKAASNYTLRNLMIGYGLARQLVPVSPEQEALILDWFKDRVDAHHHIYPDNAPVGSLISPRADNHGTANYMTALVFGILVGDRSMLQPGMDTWHEAMRFLREDGSFPTEMNRGGAWLHYSTLQLGRLLATSELVRPQGIDLGAEFDDPRYSLPNAFEYILNALEDFDVAEQYSKGNHLPFEGMTPRAPMVRGFSFGFLPAYAERYGNDENMQRLATATIDGEICDERVIAEDKLMNSGFCQRYNGAPVPLNVVVATSNPEPNWHMGYPAGCVQATRTWKSLLGFEAQ